MNLKFEPVDKKNALLTLDGDATIYKIDEIKVALLRALKEAKHLTINLKSVTKADFSFLQLLCAAHKDLAASKQRSLDLVGSERLAKIIGGAYSEISCSVMNSEKCLFEGRATDDR